MSKPNEVDRESRTPAGAKKHKTRTRRRRWWISIAALVLIAGGAAFALQRSRGGQAEAQAAEGDQVAAEDEETRVPVELAVARTADLPSFFNATGTLEAQRRVDLIAKTQGQVTRLLVEEGDVVKRGQVLLELDHREQALLVEEARVRADTARLELERRQNMAARGLETERALEEAQQSFEVNQAQLELAKVRLDDHIVRAPFSGRVTVRHVELGQTVQVGAPLAGLADSGPLEVRLFLPEQIVTRLDVGQPVQIRPDVARDTLLRGIVERIAPVVDSATSTIKVTLRVDPAKEVARVGSFVRARITTDVHEEIVAVPKKAIVAEAGANYVFVAEADTVRRVDVKTGYTDDGWIEVTNGIAVGDRVVVVGQGGLREGSRIEDLASVSDHDSSSDSDDPSEQLARNR